MGQAQLQAVERELYRRALGSRAAAGDRRVGGFMTRTAPEPERQPDKAAEIQADKAPASAHRGGPDVDGGRHQRAIEQLDKEIQLQPSHGAYIRRGNAFADLGQYQRAIADFDQAIQLQPDDLSVYYLRGIAKFKSGDEAGSQRDFQRAKDLGF
jgi:tetratricopeptide (TPR) repeat protein